MKLVDIFKEFKEMKQPLQAVKAASVARPVGRRAVLGSAAVVAAGAAVWGAVPRVAQAQFRVDIAGVGLRQLPIAMPVFRGQDAAGVAIAEVAGADLERSGQFARVAAASALPIDESAAADFAQWRELGADAMVAGSIERLDDGRFAVRFRLWDVVRAQDLGGQAFVAAAADLRLIAHRVADFVYERLTGERGVFATRICYVSQLGTGAAARYALWVADADGHNAQAALTSAEPIISPVWSARGDEIAYVSFEARRPVVWVHTLATGQRRVVANFRGSNSAPAFSADGQWLAVALTLGGSTQIYAVPAAGVGAANVSPRKLVQSASIDTEPTFSADGRHLYFVSDRGGAPQIYRAPAAGGAAERVTFEGAYNVSPSLSADGKWLAHIRRDASGYRLHVQDVQTGASHALTSTAHDESPSFAPNGRLILYATRVGAHSALMVTTLDGKIKVRLPANAGDIREPAWGPWRG